MAKKPSVKYPETPIFLTNISQTYIKEYFAGEIAAGRLTSGDAQKFSKTAAKCIKEADKQFAAGKIKNARQVAFQEYRKAFAKKYFPNLLRKKSKEDKLVKYLNDL